MAIAHSLAKHTVLLLIAPGTLVSDLVLVLIERLTPLRPPASIFLAIVVGFHCYFVVVGVCVISSGAVPDDLPPLSRTIFTCSLSVSLSPFDCIHNVAASIFVALLSCMILFSHVCFYFLSHPFLFCACFCLLLALT